MGRVKQRGQTEGYDWMARAEQLNSMVSTVRTLSRPVFPSLNCLPIHRLLFDAEPQVSEGIGEPHVEQVVHGGVPDAGGGLLPRPRARATELSRRLTNAPFNDVNVQLVAPLRHSPVFRHLSHLTSLRHCMERHVAHVVRAAETLYRRQVLSHTPSQICDVAADIQKVMLVSRPDERARVGSGLGLGWGVILVLLGLRDRYAGIPDSDSPELVVALSDHLVNPRHFKHFALR